MVVPNEEELQVRLLEHIYCQPAVGHPGQKRTYQLVKARYYWPQQRQMVKQYVRNCHECCRAKAPTGKYQGLLQPLSIPERPWQNISVDFVGPLPESKGSNTIMVVIDRLTKMRHYIACYAGNDTLNAEEMANLFLQHVWKLHGLPNSIVSDRGSTFVSYFWLSLCKLLGIEQKLSIAFHPQSDS